MVSLESLCGGLVSSNFLDNPLAYKFTWSPEGVFRALSDAKYMRKGQVKKISRSDLLYHTFNYDLNSSMNLAYYPNRDSLKYRELYNVPEVKKILRGTIRYKGYCEIVACFLDLGILEIEELKDKRVKFNIIELLNFLT